MTTRSRRAPVLDRFISQTTDTISGGGSVNANLRYQTSVGSAGDVASPGEYNAGANVFSLALKDSDDENIPVPAVDTVLAVGYRGGFNSRRTAMVTVTSVMVHADRLDIAYSGASIASSQELTIAFSTSTPGVITSVTRNWWAARRELRTTDQLTLTDAGPLTINDVFFVVRTSGEDFAVGDTFMDDRSVRRTIQGLNYEEYGRGRYTTILARAITA